MAGWSTMESTVLSLLCSMLHVQDGGVVLCTDMHDKAASAADALQARVQTSGVPTQACALQRCMQGTGMQGLMVSGRRRVEHSL